MSRDPLLYLEDVLTARLFIRIPLPAKCLRLGLVSSFDQRSSALSAVKTLQLCRELQICVIASLQSKQHRAGILSCATTI